MAIWYILWSFWYIFFPVLVCCAKKNLATPERIPEHVFIEYLLTYWHFHRQRVIYFRSARWTARVARFFSVERYQNVINVPNDNKLHQKAINYTKWP
jgi:hypothetical protein